MCEQQTKQTIPDIGKVLKIRFPTADPYLTGKWYCDIFDLDPNASDDSPLRENHTGEVVLHTMNGIELYLIQSDDKLSLSFDNHIENQEVYNHAVPLFQVNNIAELYKRLKAAGVEVYQGPDDPEHCIGFYDPDGRKIELGNYVPEQMVGKYAKSNIKPLLGNLLTLYLPVADPYVTGKWYCDMFDLDHHQKTHSSLRKEHTGLIALCSGKLCYYFVQSIEKSSLSFNDKNGINHALLHFEVKNIDEIHARMTAAGVKIEGDGMDDRRGSEKGFSFYDPDGRKVEISNSVTNELPPLEWVEVSC